jgi:hypothetical protein
VPISGYSSELPVSVMVVGVFDGDVGSAEPTIFAADDVDDPDGLDGDELPQAAASTVSGIKAAAVYTKRFIFATCGILL